MRERTIEAMPIAEGLSVIDDFALIDTAVREARDAKRKADAEVSAWHAAAKKGVA